MAGPLTTSLRGLWVSGLLPPGNGGLCKRAATLKPTKCHRGLTHNSRAGNPKRLRPNCHSCPRGTLEPAWVSHQGEGAQRPQCAKGKGPENPGVAAPLAASGCRGNHMFLHSTQCLVSGGLPCASVYGALRGLYMAGDLSLCICLCDREVPLVMSPVFQATGWQIVHILVWPHLLLSFAYSGDPLPTHCSTKFTTVLRG